jgi:hypothetical protein
MNKFIYRVVFAIMACLASGIAVAQEKAPEMADVMRSNGKIYVVVVVCLIILAGLFIYMATIDRKLRRLEKENQV